MVNKKERGKKRKRLKMKVFQGLKKSRQCMDFGWFLMFAGGSILKGLLGVVRREFSARQGGKEVEYSGSYLLFDIINLKLDANSS